MKKEQFIEELQEELEFDTELSVDTNLKELDEWDSMSAMVLIGFVSDKFNVTLTGDDIANITTVNSLFEKIGNNKFEN